MKRMLFPLPLFLLPNGLTRLRIIEPKHLKMVTQSVGHIGFVIVYVENNNLSDNYEWGVLVKIVDFHWANDGFLMLDVKADSLVTIDAVFEQQDNLQCADISYKPVWESFEYSLLHHSEMYELTRLLFDFYNKNSNYGELYNIRESLRNINEERRDQSEKWLCYRWLELLPINIQVKRSLVGKRGYRQSIDLLRTLILEK
ncbi:LON peptidase substrate-binding domain-containing protein [Aliivibrio kagoshimensis]|uniref:LON peptidase substrate-binding domain-containing protein n=1 Tax=Aliivibrio kagoshimensis TaxID=2910230 RepID=UPI003D1069BF